MSEQPNRDTPTVTFVEHLANVRNSEGVVAMLERFAVQCESDAGRRNNNKTPELVPFPKASLLALGALLRVVATRLADDIDTIQLPTEPDPAPESRIDGDELTVDKVRELALDLKRASDEIGAALGAYIEKQTAIFGKGYTLPMDQLVPIEWAGLMWLASRRISMEVAYAARDAGSAPTGAVTADVARAIREQQQLTAMAVLNSPNVPDDVAADAVAILADGAPFDLDNAVAALMPEALAHYNGDIGEAAQAALAMADTEIDDMNEHPHLPDAAMLVDVRSWLRPAQPGEDVAADPKALALSPAPGTSSGRTDSAAPESLPITLPSVPVAERPISAPSLLFDGTLNASPTMLSTMDTCGEAFRLKYVERRPRRPMWSSIGGTAYHEVIRRFEEAMFIDYVAHALYPGGDGTPDEWEAVATHYADAFVKAFKEETARVALGTEYPVSQWYTTGKGEGRDWWLERGPALVHTYVMAQYRRKHFVIAMPDGSPALEVHATEPGWRGYIDRIEYYPESRKLVVTDDKTGSSWPADRQQIEKYGLWVLDNLVPLLGLDVSGGVHARFWSARKGEHILSYLIDPNELRPRLARRYDDMRRMHAAGIYPLRPSSLCKSCGVAPHCEIGRKLIRS